MAGAGRTGETDDKDESGDHCESGLWSKCDTVRRQQHPCQAAVPAFLGEARRGPPRSDCTETRQRCLDLVTLRLTAPEERRRAFRRRGWSAVGAALALLLATSAGAADLSVEEVRAALARATPERPADLAGRNLRELDLSGLDFRGAHLAHADLFGAKLVGANLAGADLRFARLDLAWIMRADFTGANLGHASLFGPVVATGVAPPPASDAPRFAGADFSGARVIARLPGVDFKGARFAGAALGVDIKNQPMGQMRNDFSGADLSGADFAGADLNRAELAFAKLRGANLAGANLFGADLARADLSGADLAGADLTETDLDGTVLTGAKHLDAAKGLEKAINADKAVR